MKSFVAGGQSDVVVIDDNSGISNLLKRQAEDRGWEVMDRHYMYGAEDNNIIVVGKGHQESISRARLCLIVMISCGDDEQSRSGYNTYAPAYRAAIEEGLVEVAVPAWHPQV